MNNTISFNSYDGTELAADFFKTDGSLGALFAHGITSERTEAGFYTDIAMKLKEKGISSLSLDLRCHGASNGKQVDFLLSGAINDICAGIDKLTSFGAKKIILIAASFSGGLAVRASEIQQNVVSHLVLFNPRLTYKPWINDPAFWSNGALTQDAQNSLIELGYIERKGFKLGAPMVNELLSFDPVKGLPSLNKPILFIHGTKDTVVPIEGTRESYSQTKDCELIEVAGAQHGFTDPATDDPHSEKSRKIRQSVTESTISWISKNFVAIQ